MKGLVLVEHVDRELDVICLARMLLTPCRSLTRMYGSGRALQEVFIDLASAVLHQCIRSLIGARCAPDHHGYQRACVLISGQARRRRPPRSFGADARPNLDGTGGQWCYYTTRI